MVIPAAAIRSHEPLLAALVLQERTAFSATWVQGTERGGMRTSSRGRAERWHVLLIGNMLMLESTAEITPQWEKEEEWRHLSSESKKRLEAGLTACQTSWR